MKKLILVVLISLTILGLFNTTAVYAKDPGNIDFCSGEHIYIGNTVKIYFPIKIGDDYQYQDIYGSQADFRPWLNETWQAPNLHNALTFSKLVAMPDFFADPNSAISDGATFTDRRIIFEKCLDVFLNANVNALNQIFFYMEQETAVIEKIAYDLKHGIRPLPEYPNFAAQYFLAVPNTAKVLLIGWDHFGKYASLAYEAGHAEAIQTAIDAHNMKDLVEQRKLLVLAYAKEGYTDHFLSDRFASGHMRTPDKEIAQILPKDTASQAVAALIAILMHDEDNMRGVTVTNLRGDIWTAYGDKKYIYDDNAKNISLIHEAMQASADEVKSAFLFGVQLSPNQYAALKILSNLDQLDDFVDYVNNHGGTIPIFVYDATTNDVVRRPDINKLLPNKLPLPKNYMIPHGTHGGWNEWVTLLELEFAYHPERFVNTNSDIANYITDSKKLNDAGFRLLFSSFNDLEKALFCIDKNTRQDWKKYLQCNTNEFSTEN